MNEIFKIYSYTPVFLLQDEYIFATADETILYAIVYFHSADGANANAA